MTSWLFATLVAAVARPPSPSLPPPKDIVRPEASPPAVGAPMRLRRGEGKGLVTAGSILLGISETWLWGVEGVYAGLAGYYLRNCWEGSPHYDEDDCEDDDLVLIVVLPQRQVAMQMRWAGVSLLGAGLSVHGRRVRRSTPPPTPASLRKWKRRRRLGLGLLGASAVLAIADTLHLWMYWWADCLPAPVMDAPTYYGIRYAYLVAGKALSVAGVALGPFADGYVREDALLRRIRVGPWSLPSGAGITISGSF